MNPIEQALHEQARILLRSGLDEFGVAQRVKLPVERIREIKADIGQHSQPGARPGKPVPMLAPVDPPTPPPRLPAVEPPTPEPEPPPPVPPPASARSKWFDPRVADVRPPAIPEPGDMLVYVAVEAHDHMVDACIARAKVLRDLALYEAEPTAQRVHLRGAGGLLLIAAQLHPGLLDIHIGEHA